MTYLAKSHRRRHSALMILLTVVLLAGCGGGEQQEQAVEAQEAPAQTTTLTQAQEALIEQAATVANAIEKAPTEFVKILAGHGLTAEKYKEIVYQISADPVLARAYEDARKH